MITYSSGNHAQAIALASRLLDAPATIIMPGDAPAAKIAATRGYGAEVVLYDRYSQDREAFGREIAQARGLTLIPPFNHPDVIAGQGTLAQELIETRGPTRRAGGLPRRRRPARGLRAGRRRPVSGLPGDRRRAGGRQ